MSNVPENVKEILRDLGFDSSDYWSLQLPKNKKVTILTHKALERVAASKNVVLDPPQIIEADSANKRATVLVVGHYNDKTEWSFGEASPHNNKNSYPWAMAEKRAKDRVILKLIGLHGDVYSSVDDFEAEESQNDQAPKPEPQQNATAVPVPVEQPEPVNLINQDQVQEIEELAKKAKIEISKIEAQLKYSIDKIPVERHSKVVKYLKEKVAESKAAKLEAVAS